MNNNNRSIVEKDAIKKATDRAIGKLLESLGDTISPLVEKEIKHHFRWYENNIRDIFNNIRGNQNDTTKSIR